MTEIKSCVTCNHCYNPDSWHYVYCDKYTYETTDYVRGEVIEWREQCENLREPNGKCGPDATGWEQRVQKEKKKPKMESFWFWIGPTR